MGGEVYNKTNIGWLSMGYETYSPIASVNIHFQTGEYLHIIISWENPYFKFEIFVLNIGIYQGILLDKSTLYNVFETIDFPVW